MKSKLIRTGLVALALTLAAPVTMAPAQEINSIYVTPKLSYVYQKGDMSSGNWHNGGWHTGAVGGNDNDNGFGIGVAVGTDLGYYYEVPVRVELEYMYRTEAEFGQGARSVSVFGAGGPATLTASQNFKVSAHSLMANGFFDINTQTDFTPYLGAGLGLAYLDTDYRSGITMNNIPIGASSSDGSWNFAWSLMAGVGYSINENLTLDLGYRYIDLGSGDAGTFNASNGGISYSGSPSVDYTAHELGLGLRFTGF